MDIAMSSSLVDDYLLIKITGRIETLDDMKSITRQMYDEIIKHERMKVIVDQTENTTTDSLANQIELVKFYSEEFPLEVKRLKAAVVTDSKNKRIAGFWETYASNRGFPFKVFYSMEDAREYMSG